uniref:Uncharacterized protein n=1 Tax=Arundo donax TaxID=35708 RepID=A0A0A9HSH6_ARUDO
MCGELMLLIMSVIYPDIHSAGLSSPCG